MRVKFRTKRKYKLIKFILFILIISLIIKITINIIKKDLNNITSKEFIKDIFYSSEYDNKYLNPEYILEYTSTIKDTPTINEVKEKEIYIYSTHEQESYSFNGLETYNITPNVKIASSILKDKLEQYNIYTDIELTSITDILKANNWSYSYSYKASRTVIEPVISNNNYKLIIDLHRDSSSLDKTKLSYNGTDYAKILFVIGTEYNNENNLKIATNLNNIINNKVTDLSRGILKKGGKGNNGIYNQDLNNNMILIELGGPYNTLEEIDNTLDILSLSIKEYLEGEI